MVVKSKENWDWKIYLKKNNNDMTGVSVSCFPHVPLSSAWDGIIGEGRVVECKVKHEDVNEQVMWFGKVIQMSGYMAKIRFIGFTPEEEKKFKQIERWVHFDNLFRIGYSKENSKDLHPPIKTEMKKSVLQSNVLEELIGKMTLSSVRELLLQQSSECRRFKRGENVEVLRRAKGFQMCVAIVRKRDTGRRVLVSFLDDRSEMWCHEDWEFIKPAGWCQAVGMPLSAPAFYNKEPISEKDVLSDPNIAGFYSRDKINVEKDMVFELINPLKEGEIVTGKITNVLKYGYFQYKVISELSEEEKTIIGDQGQFFAHVTVPSIFPCGFCKEHNIPFLLPLDFVNAFPKSNGDDNKENEKEVIFSWDKYFEKTGLSPLPLQTYQEKAKEKKLLHVLEVGMKLEAQDAQVSDMICPATIVRVVEPFIVKLSYDGWGAEFDEFKSWNSTEIFPVGWSRLVSLPLSPPFEGDIDDDDDSVCSVEDNDEEKEKEEPKRKISKVPVKHIKGEPMDVDNNKVKIEDAPKPKNQRGRKPQVKKPEKKKVGRKPNVVKATSAATVASIPVVTSPDPSTSTTTSGRPKRNAKKPSFFGQNICLR